MSIAEIFRQLQSQVLEHPLCSPNLTPVDCRLLDILTATVEVTSFPVAKKWMDQCMHVLPFSQKHLFFGAFRIFFIAGLNILESSGTKWKNYAVTHFLLLLH